MRVFRAADNSFPIDERDACTSRNEGEILKQERLQIGWVSQLVVELFALVTVVVFQFKIQTGVQNWDLFHILKGVIWMGVAFDPYLVKAVSM